MLHWLRQLIKPEYEPLNRVEIIRGHIINNFNYLQAQQPGKQLWPVLKSNAYGHGLKEVCQILNDTAAKTVVVDSFPEAQIAYRYFRGRVLILGEMPLAAYRYADFSRTDFCVYNIETFKYLAKNHRHSRIHLFINTGMNREGIANLPEFWQAVASDLKNLKIVGLASHLAAAETESGLNQKQIDNFFCNLDYLRQQGIDPEYVHLGNSAGIFSLHDNRLSVFRPGLALYGYNPFTDKNPHYLAAQKLKPALRVLSQIVALQNLVPGDFVSYNQDYQAQVKTTIGVIPFGYFEGLDRRLANTAEFRCLSSSPFYARIAGRVCMNLTALDLGQNQIRIGDRVEIISPSSHDLNSVANLALLSHTIPYVISR